VNNPFLTPPQKPVDEAPIGVLIDGTFACMTCNETCDEAEYFPVEKVLVWLCNAQHKSVIENFSLGV
jgi:hypothetical protein